MHKTRSDIWFLFYSLSLSVARQILSFVFFFFALRFPRHLIFICPAFARDASASPPFSATSAPERKRFFFSHFSLSSSALVFAFLARSRSFSRSSFSWYAYVCVCVVLRLVRLHYHRLEKPSFFFSNSVRFNAPEYHAIIFNEILLAFGIVFL